MAEIERPLIGEKIDKPEIETINTYYLKQYYKGQKQEEQYFALGIKNQTLAFIFDLLIKLSYILFVIAVAINMTSSSSQTTTKFFVYATNEDKLPFLIFLAFQAILVYSLMKIYTQPNKILPETRKNVNFLTDIARTVTYIVLIIFVQPFVYTQGIPIITMVSFWFFVIALFLFIIRKIIKWQYYKFGDGAKETKRWQSIANNNSFGKLFDTATFIAYFQKELSNPRNISLINVEAKQYLQDFCRRLEYILKNEEKFDKQIKDQQQKFKILRKIIPKMPQKQK